MGDDVVVQVVEGQAVAAANGRDAGLGVQDDDLCRDLVRWKWLAIRQARS
jgi:hypothetical protein